MLALSGAWEEKEKALPLPCQKGRSRGVPHLPLPGDVPQKGMQEVTPLGEGAQARMQNVPGRVPATSRDLGLQIWARPSPGDPESPCQ